MPVSENTPLLSSASNRETVSKSKKINCCSVFKFLANLGAYGILIGLNVFLFLQLQAVTFQVANNTNAISNLQSELNDQASKTSDINEKVEKAHSLTIINMAGTFVLLTCLVATFHIVNHLRNYHEGSIQRKIIAILWMTPIYGITSFISLCFPMTHEYMMILKDLYEAYCVYQFLSFLIAVLGKGDRDVVVKVLAKHVDHLNKPYKCLSCFYHPNPNESDYAMSNAILLECQILAMQFVFIKPITSIASFVLNVVKDYDESNGNNTTDSYEEESRWMYLISPEFIILMIQNISVFFAFKGLLKFYHAVKDDLMWCQPFSKFLCIKGVVFLTFWQGLIISMLINLHPFGMFSEIINTNGNTNYNGNNTQQQPFTKDNIDAWIQSILICLEMLFFSLAHWCVFPTDEWKEDYRPRKIEKPGMGFKDFVDDISVVFDHAGQNKRAAAAAASLAVIHDADSSDDNIDIPSQSQERGGAWVTTRQRRNEDTDHENFEQ